MSTVSKFVARRQFRKAVMIAVLGSVGLAACAQQPPPPPPAPVQPAPAPAPVPAARG